MEKAQSVFEEISANLTVCAGYLSCIFRQAQYGRPLTFDEACQAHKEAVELADCYMKVEEDKIPWEVLRPTFLK